MKSFSDDSFSFFQEHVLIIIYFFDFMWSSNKVFKDFKIFWTVHSRPFIMCQGRNLDWFRIWCCLNFFLDCLVQPNQDIHFLLYVIFITRIRLWIIQTVNLYFYSSEILLFKVFINACKVTGEMTIDWSFFLAVWHSVNSLSVSLTGWNLSWSSKHLVCI